MTSGIVSQVPFWGRSVALQKTNESFRPDTRQQEKVHVFVWVDWRDWCSLAPARR